MVDFAAAVLRHLAYVCPAEVVSINGGGDRSIDDPKP